jgi:thiol-disulfide isomerase/thioredoxin
VSRPEHSMGRWQARTLRRAKGSDVFLSLSLVVLASLTVMTGRKASTYLSPEATQSVAKALDDLELPDTLPDAALVDEHGTRQSLLGRMTKPRALVAFYAAWCGPCQEELPELDRELDQDRANLFVVIGKNDDRIDTRRKLDNLGLRDLGFLVDESDQLTRSARVTSLPTTFAITKQGRVLGRAKGFSRIGIWRMVRKVAGDSK